MASAERELITGVWGGAPAVRGSGAKPPEAESILALGRPTKTANCTLGPLQYFQFKASYSNLNP